MVTHITDRTEFCPSLTFEKILLLVPPLDAFFGSVDRTKKTITIVVRIQIFSIRLIIGLER